MSKTLEIVFYIIGSSMLFRTLSLIVLDQEIDLITQILIGVLPLGVLPIVIGLKLRSKRIQKERGITLEYADKNPLRININLHYNNSVFEYYLAARIEN